MRHSFLLIAGTVATAASLSLSACKDDAGAQQPIKIAKQATAGNSSTKAMETKFTKRAGTGSADLCYNDICSGSSYKSMDDILQAAGTGVKVYQDYYAKNLLPLLQTKATNYQKLAQTRLQRLNDEEKNFAAVTLNPAQEKTIKTILLLSQNSAISKDISDAAKAALGPLDFQKALQIFIARKGTSYFQTLFANKDLNVAVQEEAQNISNIQQQLNKALGGSLINIDNDSMKKALKKGALTTLDIETISQTSFAIRYLNYFVNGDGAALLEKIDLKSIDLMKLYQDSTVKSDLQKNSQSQTAAVKECETRFYQTTYVYPTQDQINQFKVVAEKVRKSAAGLLPANDPAINKIMNAQIQYPKNQTDITSDWVAALQDDMTYEPQEMDRLKSYDTSTMYVLALISAMMPEKSNPLCGNLIDLSISDKTLPTNGFIALSWVSVRMPKLGVPILAHEFGHIVDAYSTTFADARVCVRDKQGTDQYSGEDFADWFSTKVAMDLQATQKLPSDNMGCFFAASAKSLSLVNSDSADVHSSDLYRALQIANAKGQASTNCNQLVQEQSKGTNVLATCK